MIGISDEMRYLVDRYRAYRVLVKARVDDDLRKCPELSSPVDELCHSMGSSLDFDIEGYAKEWGRDPDSVRSAVMSICEIEDAFLTRIGEIEDSIEEVE